MSGSHLEKRIMEELSAFSGCRVRRHHGSRYGRAGEPDLIGTYRGLAFLIEVKSGTGRLEPKQQEMILEWQEAGAYVECARDDFDARRFLIRVTHNFFSQCDALRDVVMEELSPETLFREGES